MQVEAERSRPNKPQLYERCFRAIADLVPHREVEKRHVDRLFAELTGMRLTHAGGLAEDLDFLVKKLRKKGVIRRVRRGVYSLAECTEDRQYLFDEKDMAACAVILEEAVGGFGPRKDETRIANPFRKVQDVSEGESARELIEELCERNLLRHCFGDEDGEGTYVVSVPALAEFVARRDDPAPAPRSVSDADVIQHAIREYDAHIGSLKALVLETELAVAARRVLLEAAEKRRLHLLGLEDRHRMMREKMNRTMRNIQERLAEGLLP